MDSLNKVKKDLKRFADTKRAKISQGFFKTGKGQYGEGDIFIGVIVPNIRKVAKENYKINLLEIGKLLRSKIHEERLCALLMLVDKFENNDGNGNKIFYFYIENTKYINNWDLVDLSAPKIVGAYLIDKAKDILYKLALSESLWEKRISIISTLAFIRVGKFSDTFKISKILMRDKHDLIHKAVGWMLREAGKKNRKKLKLFLKRHYKKMPRTMLRYAIEKFPESEREGYLKGIA